MRKSIPERLRENPNPTSEDIVDWIAEDLRVLCKDAPVPGVAHLGKAAVSLAAAMFGAESRVIIVEERAVGDEVHANILSTSPDIPSTLRMLLEAARQLTEEIADEEEDGESDVDDEANFDRSTLH